MSSNSGIKGIRQVRRKKSSLSEVKIVVLGAPGVGKTALTVRFLTKRYIGEYDHQSDSRYKHEIMVDGDPVIFEICDTCTKEVKGSHSKDKDMPMVILGNKGDMVHLRQVSSEEGEILSKDYDCNFFEVAAADQVTEVADAFHELFREVNATRRKNKTSLLDRVLGTKSGNRVYHRGKSDSSLAKFQ